MNSMFRFCATKILLGGLLLSIFACDPKPDIAMCGDYYSNFVRVSRGGPRVLQQVVSSSSSKAGIMDYCLIQPRHQIQCAIGASSLGGIQECESMPKQSIMDSLPDFSQAGETVFE